MQLINRKIGVIGAGSWGTALAILLAGKGYRVVLWGHDSSLIKNLRVDRENLRYLPGISFPPTLEVSENLENAVSDCNVVCMVVPSHGFRSVYEKIVPFIQNEATVVSAVKGIENKSLMTMTQVMEDVNQYQMNDKKVITAVLSGPSFAKEVALKIPTAITIGCKDISIAKMLQTLFSTDFFRVYASQDVIGLEISASLKNIVAVAAGICDGLGYGLNTRAALITRGLAEMSRLGVAMGAEPATFSGLSGLGDLVLTCTGNLSRNRTVGLKLGQGLALDDIIDEMDMVAEGVKTTQSGYELAQKMGIEMPILEQIYEILYKGKSCAVAVQDLLKRESKIE